MPRVAPYGTPAMKAQALATRKEKGRVENLFLSLDILKRKLKIRSDAKFADALGLSYSRYRRMKDRPDRITLGEVWLLCEAAAQYGETLSFGTEEGA